MSPVEWNRQPGGPLVRANPPLCVMVVDDEPLVRELVAEHLREAGHDVITAVDGEDAISRFKNSNVQVVILDVVMPRMDGADVCAWIRQSSDVPIIMLSAHADYHEKARYIDLGADDYMTKPFGAAELLARINAVSRRASRTSKRSVGDPSD